MSFPSIQKIKSKIINAFYDLDKINYFLSADYKSPKVLQGKILAKINESIIPQNIQELEFQVFSQFGDDGIIQWLVNQLPSIPKTFIEFGVEDYRESNTRFLLVNNNWSGFVIDGSEKNITRLKKEQLYTFFDLKAENSFITLDNIKELLVKSGFTGPIGILSIDIDGNDYWIWEKINLDAVIIIIEYNSLFGFEHPYTIEYEPNFVRGNNTPFQFYGSSLKSLNDLAEKKGYSFIGCNSSGNNAYFIKNGYLNQLPIDKIPLSEGYNFASFTEVKKDLSPLRGIEKIRSIHGLKVYNTSLNKLDTVNAEEIITSLFQFQKINRF